MDLACFETLMKLQGWDNKDYGLSNSEEDFEITDVTFRNGTRTIIIPADEVHEMDSEDFDVWYKHRTKGFTY